MSAIHIALTSANEAAMKAVATQLATAAVARRLQLAVHVGVNDAAQAEILYREGGELWRIGDDDSRPELDALVDREIDDSSPGRMAADADQALDRLLGKVRVAA